MEKEKAFVDGGAVPVLSKIEAVYAYVMDPVRNAPTGQVHPDRLHADLAALTDDERSQIRVTGKIDGTCCWVHDGKMHARQDIRCGKGALPTSLPPGWIPTHGTVPDAGGHVIGFRPIDPARDKWHVDAVVRAADGTHVYVQCWVFNASSTLLEPRLVHIGELEGCTMELIGPKVQSNPHGVPHHGYVKHGSIVIEDLREWHNYDKVVEFMKSHPLGKCLEGIVLHDTVRQKCYKLHRGHLQLPARVEHSLYAESDATTLSANVVVQ